MGKSWFFLELCTAVLKFFLNWSCFNQVEWKKVGFFLNLCTAVLKFVLNWSCFKQVEWAEVSALLWDVSRLDSLDPILVERLLSEQIKILEKLPGKIKLSFLNLYSGDLNTRQFFEWFKAVQLSNGSDLGHHSKARLKMSSI